MAAELSTDVKDRLAGSVWGLLLARFVTPALVAIAIFLGNNYLSKLDQTMTAMAVRQDKLEDIVGALRQQVAGIEAGRAAATKSRDDQIDLIISQLSSLREKVDAGGAAIAGLTAKVEILLQRAEVDGTPSPHTAIR